MTAWQKSDLAETQAQLRKPNPVCDGKTWLRHREDAQSAIIDLMILDGKYSIRDIAEELNSRFKPERTVSARMHRVRDHIEHLQQGSSRDKISGVKGHQLMLEEVNGKWCFVEE